MIAMIGTSDRLCWLAETCKILLLLLLLLMFDLQPDLQRGDSIRSDRQSSLKQETDLLHVQYPVMCEHE